MVEGCSRGMRGIGAAVHVREGVMKERGAEGGMWIERCVAAAHCVSRRMGRHPPARFQEHATLPFGIEVEAPSLSTIDLAVGCECARRQRVLVRQLTGILVDRIAASVRWSLPADLPLCGGPSALCDVDMGWCRRHLTLACAVVFEQRLLAALLGLLQVVRARACQQREYLQEVARQRGVARVAVERLQERVAGIAEPAESSECPRFPEERRMGRGGLTPGGFEVDAMVVESACGIVKGGLGGRRRRPWARGGAQRHEEVRSR